MKPLFFGGIRMNLAACAALLVSCAGAQCDEGDSDARDPQDTVVLERFADKGRAFAPIYADPREAQFKLGYLHEFGGKSFFDFTIGGDADLAYWSGPGSRRTSLSGRGLISSRFELNSDSFDLQNTDFQGGLALGTACGDRSYEAYLFHQSSHLGDELVGSGSRSKIDYIQNSARLLASQKWGHLRGYCGLTVNFFNEPDEYDNRFQFQVGAEKRFLEGTRPMYLAVDIQAKEGLDWHPNAIIEFGVELGNLKTTKNRQRLYIQLFTGYSNMGQFYNERESYLLFGVAYNAV